MTECPPVLIGEKVWWLGSGSGLPKKGVIRWIGKLPEISSDWAIGIELEERLPYGGVDGTWRGRELFKCKKNHGLLVPSDRVVSKGSAGGLCREDALELAKAVDRKAVAPPRQKRQGLLLDRHEDFASVHREAVRLRREQNRIAETLLERVGEDGDILPRSRDTTVSDRRQKTQSGLFSFFRWFRRERPEERCQSNPGSPSVLRRSESSLLGSVDTLFSTATATSFSFVRPCPRASRLLASRIQDDITTAPAQPRCAISIREKYNLYASGSLARSLDDLRPNEPGYYTLRKRRAPQPPATDSLPTTLNKVAEEERLHRRTVSESAKYRRPSHIKGKRRAPPPPENASAPTTPTTPEPQSLPNDVEECGPNTLRRKRKAPPPPIDVSGSSREETVLEVIVENDSTKRDGERTSDAGFSTDTLRLEKGVLKPTMDHSYAEPRQVPTSPVSPRPWYKRAPTEPKEVKKAKDSTSRSLLDDWMIESGFPRRSNGLKLFSKESADDKRKSGVTMLANISQLDREAAEIVRMRSQERRDEQKAAERNAKYFAEGSCQTEVSENAKKASTRQLISLFNSITATVNATARQESPATSGNSLTGETNGLPQVQEETLRIEAKAASKPSTSSAATRNEETAGAEAASASTSTKEDQDKKIYPRRGSGDSSSSGCSSSSFKVWTGASAISRKLVVWACPRCTLENARWRLTCEACDMWRPPMADYNVSKPSISPVTLPNKEEPPSVPVPIKQDKIDQSTSAKISTSQIHTLSNLKESKPLYPRLDEIANLDKLEQPTLTKDKLINIPVNGQQEEVRNARLAYFEKNSQLQKINCLGEPAFSGEEEKMNLREMLKYMKDSLPKQSKDRKDVKPSNISTSKEHVINEKPEKKPKNVYIPRETSFDSVPLKNNTTSIAHIPYKSEPLNNPGPSKVINEITPTKLETIKENGIINPKLGNGFISKVKYPGQKNETNIPIVVERNIPIQQEHQNSTSKKSDINIPVIVEQKMKASPKNCEMNIPIVQEKGAISKTNSVSNDLKSNQTHNKSPIVTNVPVKIEKTVNENKVESRVTVNKSNVQNTNVKKEVVIPIRCESEKEGNNPGPSTSNVKTPSPAKSGETNGSEKTASGYFVTIETRQEEIVKPGKVSSSAQTSSKVLKESNNGSKEEILIPVMIEEYSTQGRQPMDAGQFASRVTANQTEDLPKEDKTAKSHELYLNTMALNRLLRRLEAAIAGGQLDLAADLAKELALLRVSCSVVRQRHQPTDIMLDVHLEGRDGGCGRLNVRAKPWMRLGDLAARVERDHALPRAQQRWIINKKLADDPRATLSSLGINPSNPVFLYLVAEGEARSLDGGSHSAVENDPKQPGSTNSPVPGPSGLNSAAPVVPPPRSKPPPSRPRFTQATNFNSVPSPQVQSPIPSNVQSPVMSPTFQSPLVQSPTSSIHTPPLVEYPMSPEPLEGWKCTSCSCMNAQETFTCSRCKATKLAAIQNGVTIVEEIEEDDGHYERLLELEKSELVTSSVEFECPVCLTNCNPIDGIVLRECLHTFCRGCLIDTVKYSEDAEVKCPYRDTEYTCDGILLEREIKALVPQEVYEDHLAKSVALAESRIANAFHCKTADCVGWCIYEDNVNTFTCPVCSKTNCLTCQAIHAGMNCKEYQEQLANKSSSSQEAKRTADMLQDMVKRGEAMECPTCHVVLMKKWGCDWLRCSVCRTEICWITRGPRWGPAGKGDTTGGCKCGVNGVRCHPKCTYCH